MDIYSAALQSDLRRVDSLEALVTMFAAVSTVLDAYEKLDLDVPEDLTGREQAIAKEAASRAEAQKRKRLQLLLAQRATLRTAEEKRQAVEDQIAQLESELNISQD